MSKIKVLYFAGIKDITKKEYEEIELSSDTTTLNELSDKLISIYGDKFKEILTTSMYAIDMEYIEKENESVTIVKNASEVAIIPPVSGG